MKFLGVDPTKCWNPGKLFKKEDKPVPRPSGRDQVIEWWKATQKTKKVGMEKDGTVTQWFHGKSPVRRVVDSLRTKTGSDFRLRFEEKFQNVFYCRMVSDSVGHHIRVEGVELAWFLGIF